MHQQGWAGDKTRRTQDYALESPRSKNQNLEMSIGTCSMRQIRPYGHILQKIQVFADLGGLGIFLEYSIYIYIYIYIYTEGSSKWDNVTAK